MGMKVYLFLILSFPGTWYWGNYDNFTRLPTRHVVIFIRVRDEFPQQYSHSAKYSQQLDFK